MPALKRQFTRVAVVQLDYHPAALLQRRSPLADPLFSLKPGAIDSLLPDSGLPPTDLEVRLTQLRYRIREAYGLQLLRKVQCILDACRQWGVRLVVFPEYSIPYDILGPVADASRGMVVVAGTHLVERDAIRSGIYQKLGALESPQRGTAVAPVLADGRLVGLVGKMNPARHEE